MKHKGSWFYSIFILLSAIIITLIIFFLGWLYLSISSNIKVEYSDNRKYSLEQTINTLESELQNIEYSFNAYSTTKSYQEVIDYPLSIKDFDKYREITSQLNYFSTPNLYNTDYTLISLNQGWMIKDNRIVNLTEDEIISLTNYYIENNHFDLYWDNDPNGMAVVTRLPVFSREKSGIGIAKVANSDIDQLIASRNVSFPLAILNTDGDLLYTSKNNEVNLNNILQNFNVTETSLNSSNSVIEMKIPKTENEFTLFYKTSSYNNLVYLTVLYNSEISTSLSPTFYGFVILAVFLISIAVGLSWGVSNYLTGPLRKLKNELISGEGQVKNTNDFMYLKNTFEAIRNQKESLELALELERPALRRQLVLNALLGKNNADDFYQKKDAYGFPLISNPVYYVLIAQLDEFISSESVEQLYKLLIIMEQAIPAEIVLASVVISERNVGAIISIEKSEANQEKLLIEVSEEIIILAKNETKLSVSIGLSSAYTDFKETSKNYKRALQSLSYKLLLGNQSIVSFEDIKEMNTMSYSDKDFTKLTDDVFNAIQLGKVEVATNNTHYYLATLYRNSDSPADIEFGLLRFFINLSELDRSLETHILTRKLTEIFYQNLLFNRNIIKIEDILLNDIIFVMTTEMEQRTREQFEQLSTQIKEAIHNNYEKDISLDFISDQLNYNPNYISSIFKKETGVTFSDYVMEVRFDKAKELLTETDMTVKEIAELLHYSNSQNFIRSFKKIEAMTPGQFRKEHQRA